MKHLLILSLLCQLLVTHVWASVHLASESHAPYESLHIHTGEASSHDAADEHDGGGQAFNETEHDGDAHLHLPLFLVLQWQLDPSVPDYPCIVQDYRRFDSQSHAPPVPPPNA